MAFIGMELSRRVQSYSAIAGYILLSLTIVCTLGLLRQAWEGWTLWRQQISGQTELPEERE